MSVQAYFDQNEPGWKVTALRIDDTSYGDDATKREHYYVVISNGNKEKVEFIVSAEFIDNAGEKKSRFYKPVILPPNRIEDLRPN